MTVDQQDVFLVELGRSGNVVFACVAAGVTRREALEHRDRDPEFERGWRAMQRHAARRVKPR